MTRLVENTAEVALILGAALLMLPLLRRRSAALRHALLASAFACAAAAPALGLLAPSWRVPAPALTAPAGAALAPARPAERAGVLAGVQTAARPDSLAPVPWTRAVLWVWALGAVAGLGVLAIGAGRLARLSAAAGEITTGAWPRHVEDLKQRWNLTVPVRILQSRHAGLLVTWGLRSP